MPNEALRRAMAEAHVTEADLAKRCGVDVKTVSRWITADGRLPHPRHRWAASEALGVDEAMLWPEGFRRNVKVGPDREIAATYPYRSACPKSVWRTLITDASEEMTFAGFTNYFLWLELPNLRSVLRRKAAAGCRVRFLVGDPDSQVTRHREQVEGVPLTVGTRIRITLAELARIDDIPNIETRFGDDHIAMSVFRFDDQMLVTPHLARLVGHDSPMLHLRRMQDDGLFDRFAFHLNELWEMGRPVDLSQYAASPE